MSDIVKKAENFGGCALAETGNIYLLNSNN